MRLDPLVWHLATPEHLLLLLKRLQVPPAKLARELGVSPSAVSMWHHHTRVMPSKYRALVRARTQLAVQHAAEVSEKMALRAPTEALRQGIREEFQAIVDRWAAEVRAADGWYGQLRQHYDAVGECLATSPMTPDTREVLRLLLAHMQALVQHGPEEPRA